MKAHNIIKSVLALSLAVVAVSSCQEKIGGSGFVKGEAVRFSIGTDVTDTKAAYSGQGTTTIERINWEPGDLIRIYCGAVSEPEEKFADYVVTEIVGNEGAVSKARIGHTSLGQLGLRWGEGPHTFYAVYPRPEVSGVVTKTIEDKDVTAELPASQAIVGNITTSTTDATLKIAAPDLKNMLMTAKSNTYTEASGITDEVFLSFIPLTTAVQFTITNQTGKNIKVKSVSLISGNGKATAPAINGAFNVDIDNSLRPAPINLGASTITYSRDYPSCMRDASLETTVDLSLRTSTISFDSPVPLAYDAEAADAGKLTFTFFLTPTCNFDDITFKIVMTDSDGSNTRWMSTKLGYTDGSGVLFPRFKKTTVRGIMVPEGAQWTVKYSPTVNPWKPTGDTPIDPMPEVSEGASLVTSWDTGIDEKLNLVDPYNGHEYVEIGGLKWATCNIGAKSPKEYGWYFSWAGTTGYVRAGSKWVTAQGGSELSGGFSWAKTPYNTAGVNTSWNKYIPTDKPTYWTGGGSPDNILFLEPDDDAAHVNWGGSWRMPTQADFQTLYEACGGTGASVAPTALPSANPGKGIYWVSSTQAYISDYAGVAGILFCDGISKLFFVAAGYGVDGNFNDEGFSGRYWSGSVYPNPPCNASRLGFKNDDVSTVNANERRQGFPVRPVSE